MEENLFQFITTAFITLIVVVDPFGLVPMYLALTSGFTPVERRQTLIRAITVAFGVSIFFLVAGKATLYYLGVSVHAFAISGGILLFATAMPMLFGQRPATMAPESSEQETTNDVAVFPLAIPLLSGPGTITAILVLTTEATGNPYRTLVLGGVIAAVYLSTIVILTASRRVFQRMGEGGLHIATRVMGIVVAALAVQFVLNGISGYYTELVAK